MQMIRARLESAFAPETLDVIDDSHLHAGHAGAKDGKGHYSVTIVSQRFIGAKPIERHRMVYEALGKLMDTDIHAVRVTALCPANS